MGHGWHTIRKTEISRKSCKCGQGFVIQYEEEDESDWHVHNRIDYRTEVKCPNKDCKGFQ